MEKNESLGEINYNVNDKQNKKYFENYYELEKETINFIDNTLKAELKTIIDKLIEKEKSFFNKNIHHDVKLVWIFNINTIHKHRGDICSSTIQKFYHSLFKEFEDDEVQRSEMTKFRSYFYDLFQTNLVLALNNQPEDDHLSLYVSKYEFKNGFLNVFFKPLGKELLDKIKNENKKVEKELEEDSFMFKAIGYLDSCFPEKFSVPRQGNLLNLTRAKIILNKNVEASCLDGLEEFDYIWIIYVFHLNQHFSKTKVAPPKYEGNKLGYMATRSPHRINPIGLTLAKLDRIEKNEIFVSSVDMISGTPILDIKPYHHLESVDMTMAKYPKWIKNQASDDKKACVVISENAQNCLRYILSNNKLIFYDDFETIINLIKGVLEIDPHSRYTMKKKETLLYAFYIDKLNVIYQYNALEKKVIVESIEFSDEYKKLRNKSWLENYCNK